MNSTVVQIGVSTATSAAVAMSANLEPLYTALITLAISIVTAVGTELVKYLVALIKSKREKLESHMDEKSDKE